MAGEAPGDGSQRLHFVEGVGDEAVWTPVSGTLTVRKGRYTLNVNLPSEEETQVAIARAVLGGN